MAVKRRIRTLREIREDSRLSREQVAVSSGCSYGYIALLEQRRRQDEHSLALALARQIASTLGVHVDEAFPPPPTRES